MIDSSDLDKLTSFVTITSVLRSIFTLADLAEKFAKIEQEELTRVLGRPPTEDDLHYYRWCKQEKDRQEQARWRAEDVEKIRRAVFSGKGETPKG